MPVSIAQTKSGYQNRVANRRKQRRFCGRRFCVWCHKKRCCFQKWLGYRKNKDYLGDTHVGVRRFGGTIIDSGDKQRVSLYLDKETMKTVDVFIKKQGYHSRNEFFEKAAKNLIAESALKSSDDILSDKLAKAIENVSAENAKAISKGLFRYAVQLEMLMRVIAKTNHFTDDDLEDMRREAVNNVHRTRGKIKLEDIAKGWYNGE